ncbi:MAG: hypothetical protein ACC661_07285, partial [Verrucomicrobiales bacterium]
SRYVEELKKVRDDLQRQGDLKKVIRVDAEIKDYAKSTERRFDEFPQLKRLRGIYESSNQRLQPEIRQARIEVLKTYVGKFEALIKTMTQQGKLDLALRADEHREKLVAGMKSLRDPSVGGRPSTGDDDILWSMTRKGSVEMIKDCEIEEKDGKWFLTSRHNSSSYANSKDDFKPPFEILARAGTDSVEIRFFYSNKQIVIFNWSSNPSQLRVENPMTGRATGVRDKGFLERNKLHDLKIQITAEKISVFASGELLGEVAGKFGDMEGPVGIGPAFGSKVTVERFAVRKLAGE